MSIYPYMEEIFPGLEMSGDEIFEMEMQMNAGADIPFDHGLLIIRRERGFTSTELRNADGTISLALGYLICLIEQNFSVDRGLTGIINWLEVHRRSFHALFEDDRLRSVFAEYERISQLSFKTRDSFGYAMEWDTQWNEHKSLWRSLNGRELSRSSFLSLAFGCDIAPGANLMDSTEYRTSIRGLNIEFKLNGLPEDAILVFPDQERVSLRDMMIKVFNLECGNRIESLAAFFVSNPKILRKIVRGRRKFLKNFRELEDSYERIADLVFQRNEFFS